MSTVLLWLLKGEPKPGGRLKTTSWQPCLWQAHSWEEWWRVGLASLMLQSVRNCSCTWWWVLHFTCGKVIPKKKKKTENDGEAHFQLSSSPQPNWHKNAVKNQTLLIIGTSMSILTRTFAAVGHSVGFQNMIILKQWLQIFKWDWTVIRGHILLFAG